IEEYDKEEEERRLFYVAMSRAKNSLYMTYHGKKPTYFITKAMLEIMEKEKKKKAPKKAKEKLSVDMSTISGDLVTKLKKWRGSLANETGLPAYCILHNKTLLEIAQVMPKTSVELQDISGLGPTKITKYGDDVLQIISDHKK
ncbi:MAG: HRDC domain-containing protein, partial [Candidatus Aenigmarchaeota archaeon]|nr:HRDC domain-containing protein [Candidatus Aenigmarchaeota archaeon]